ncbi:MAG: glycosyltransferase family 8 protein [Spirochaetaceae bacterium]|jgi:lipopolysaccharide biosynthesis glycosyltransferase|nr:glycosyltransferase family 8 protein [Spirochaetaceae bacterium]
MSEMETVPIVLCTDDNYVPFMSVTMQSVMENAGEGRYRFFVFYKEIAPASREILQKQVGKFSRFSIGFINVAEYFAARNLKPGGHLTVEAYFRLAAPYVLADYKKILYFDCDLTCRADVRKLYEIDLGDNLVGAVSQLNVFQYQHIGIQADFNKLNLKHPEKYFNSGMLLINAEQFRKTVKLEDMLDEAFRIQELLEYKSSDQDVLNVICEEKTLYLPYHWNYVIDYTYCGLPEPLKRQYIEYGKNPSIIHFQPWTHIIQTLYSRYFWDYASRTPFYAEIKKRKQNNFNKNIKKYLRHTAGYLKFGGIKPLFLILRDMLAAVLQR